MNRIKACIIGAGGYGGAGAIEILLRHPGVEIIALIDKQGAGEKITRLHPHLEGFCNLTVIPPEDTENIDSPDVVFFATPDGVGQVEAGYWLDRGAKIIDYSGDFRFNDLEDYTEYAARIGREKGHSSPDLLKDTVYGLPEINRDKISQARIVGNPGCFAVSCILGLAPGLKSEIIEPEGIICDAKTGVSGAGRNPRPQFHYPARYEAMNAYRIGEHQHVIEIEKQLEIISNRSLHITFTPHVVPLSRGILSTIYARATAGQNLKSAIDAYKSFYRDEPFIRILESGPGLSTDVRGSNFCNISINYDRRSHTFIIISMIDNLLKGQAGNAIQNMNLMFGFDETEGLFYPGQYP